MYLLRRYPRRANESVQNSALFESAWEEFVEFKTLPKLEWVGRAVLAFRDIDRVELAVHLPDGTPVAALVCGWDQWDLHVGKCFSVFAQYVHPEHRNRALSVMLMRAALAEAKAAGAGVFAWTHRTGDWTYQTKYRRLN